MSISPVIDNMLLADYSLILISQLTLTRVTSKINTEFLGIFPIA